MQSGKFEVNLEQVYLEARRKGIEDLMEEELGGFARLIRENYDFKAFLENPRIRADYKRSRLGEIFHPGLTENFVALVYLLVDKGRAELIEEISRGFTRRLYLEKNLLLAEVASAYPLSRDLKARLQKAVERSKALPVRLRYSIDRSLLGGLKIKFISGEVWDVSLKQKLRDLKAKVLG